MILLQTPQFKDEKVQPGKEYEYRVSAINEGGESEPSENSNPIKAKKLKGKVRLLCLSAICSNSKMPFILLKSIFYAYP